MSATDDFTDAHSGGYLNYQHRPNLIQIGDQIINLNAITTIHFNNRESVSRATIYCAAATSEDGLVMHFEGDEAELLRKFFAEPGRVHVLRRKPE